MAMEEVMKDIYLVEVPLPGSPLKILNSYIVKGESRHLLVDVGYHADESEQALNDALAHLGMQWADTDVFLTHLHGDHTGLIERLKDRCGKIYISEEDGRHVNLNSSDAYWEAGMAMQSFMGMPAGQNLSYKEHPGYRGGVSGPVDFHYLREGDKLTVGPYTFSVVALPGHTPGQHGLYEEEEKILFCGDHILHKITPNINSWDTEHDYLGIFLGNLQKVREMEIKLLLPGHRALIRDHVTRIDELIAHHQSRLQRMKEILSEGEKTVYEVALGVKWDFGTSYFGDFPNEQKWFAGNEVYAHLEHLRALGEAERRVHDGTFYYCLTETEGGSYFVYGREEINWLKAKDPILGAAIDEIGPIRRAVVPNLFEALINSIVGQQISTKAQVTIWKRMKERFVPLTPDVIAAASAEEVQSCGLSMRKAFYIKDIAENVRSGSLNLEELQTLSDDEVCARLSQLKGIGVWTAEMLMTFSMQRQDILSWGDLAILRGLRMLYRHRQITPKLFAKYKRRYSPYATVASLYLWAIAGGACEGLTDPAVKTVKGQKATKRTSSTSK